ncbi:glycosyltransferase [Phytomonospora sp. NPDC050363]|uniref:glycosyltransferase n=1 Tax=Phytomonospora sp. NPDC050363 TaxID=3155642 RepID=UPI0033D1BE34
MTMRVLLSTFGSRGDVQPVLALALRLRELGADVLLSLPPDFTDMVEAREIPALPIGPSVRSFVGGEKPPTLDDARAIAATLVEARFTTLAAAAEGRDVILAAGLMPAGLREVAANLGIPYVYAAYQVFGLPTRSGNNDYGLPPAAAEAVNGMYREPLNTRRSKLGLPPVDDVRAHVFTDRPWLACDPVLCPTDDIALDVVQTGAWILPDERPLPPGLEAFLDAGEPPVYVGFGSMPMRAPADPAHVAVEAARAHGRRVVLGSGWADLTVVDDRDDCFAVGEVNQQELFTRVAAVVHHGGAGTTTTAARAGAPQVVVPQMGDQPYFASRVAALGVGVAHDGPVFGLDSLSGALGAVLDPETGRRAAEVAGRIRSDGVDAAARMLFELAGKEPVG